MVSDILLITELKNPDRAAFPSFKTISFTAVIRKNSVALDHNHRGYIAINTSTDVNSKLADVKKPNQSESFMMMRKINLSYPMSISQAQINGQN